MDIMPQTARMVVKISVFFCVLFACKRILIITNNETNINVKENNDYKRVAITWELGDRLHIGLSISHYLCISLQKNTN